LSRPTFSLTRRAALLSVGLLAAGPALAAERSLYAIDQITFVRRLFEQGVKPEMLAPDLRAALERDARRHFKRVAFDWLTGAKTPGAIVDRLDVVFARNREGQVMKARLPGDIEGELIVASFLCEGLIRTRLFVLQPTPDSWLVVNVVLAPERGALLTRLEPDTDTDTGLNSMVAKGANAALPRSLTPSNTPP
jgi:hypothetical protein